MRTAAILAGLLALAACGKPDPAANQPAASPSPAAVPTPTRSADAPAALIGEWRVAGIDGAEIDAPIGIALSIDAETIAYDPHCAGFVWDYHYAAGALAPKRRQGPICEIGYEPVLDRLAAALNAAQTVRRTPSNGIELSGGGHSVLLFSQ
jgi:hypothetical protein